MSLLRLPKSLPISRCAATAGAVLFYLVLPAAAQKKSPPVPAAPRSPLPLLLGGALFGAAAGFGIATALKPRPAPAEAPDTGPGPAFADAAFPMAIINSNEAIVQANDPFLELFSLDQAEGFSFPKLMHPDDVARNRTLLQEVFNADIPGFRVNTRFFKPNGDLIQAVFTGKGQGKKRKPESILIGVENVSRRMEAEAELGAAREAMNSLYTVVSGAKDSNLDEKMRNLLMMGCNRFNLPVGALSRFDGDTIETLFVQSPDRRVRPAMRLPRAGNGTLESAMLGLGRLPNGNNWKDVPYVTENESVSYIGAPVAVREQLFGMLSFARPDPRDKPFAPSEFELLQLMGEWIGGEIERDSAREALEEQQQKLLEVNAKLESLATHDALTEVKNRRAFNEKLEEEWSRSRRYGTSLSMVLLDVDKFKSYNDTFGHPAGDEVLKRVAAIMNASVRGTDFVARYGGEEFVLLLPNTDADGAIILAERLRRKVEENKWKERPVTASFGIGTITPTMENAASLTQAADNALYASKENGRNQVTHCRDLPDNTFKLEATPA